ncbi:MAG: hypothetical protein K2H98_02395 [Duncaniella sp.]|nr:hypothetical protein [Duncaniella sp.]
MDLRRAFFRFLVDVVHGTGILTCCGGMKFREIDVRKICVDEPAEEIRAARPDDKRRAADRIPVNSDCISSGSFDINAGGIEI